MGSRWLGDVGMDISFKTAEGRFNYRVAGLIIENNKLLIVTDDQSPYYYLPGGRVLMNELSEEAIIREIGEELNIRVKVKRMLWFNENFFCDEHYDEKFHEICLYYLLDIADNNLQREDEFVVTEKERKFTFFWKDINEIKNLDLRPSFIRNDILYLPQSIVHKVDKNC